MFKKILNFIDNYEDLFCFAFVIFLLIFALFGITDYFDKKYVVRHQQYIDINSDKLVEYDNCFEFSKKYYCYINLE